MIRWEYQDRDIVARGDGAVRIASPDSARLDLFLDGGFGGARAVVIGDSVRVPANGDYARKLLPPTSLFWAALGRLAVPALPDTVVRVDGDTVHADIGRETIWRVKFVGSRIVRAERIEGGRIIERVERLADDKVKYEHNTQHRSLSLTVTRTTPVGPFDETIWTP